MTVDVPASSADTPSLAQCQAELAQLRASHEALLRAIAHDLRAPLRHVMSFAPLLRESVQELAQTAPASSREAAEDAQEFAGTMEHSARRMARMLDGLTEVSRQARAPLALQAVDALALCRAVWLSLQAQHSHLQVQWPVGGPVVLLHADEAALRSALQALLDNAAKFTQPVASPVLRVSAALEPDARYAVLTLQDSGVGFDSSRAQQLFGLFQRMHRESEFEGVGCGLALVQTVAQRHGAQVSIAAQPQQGCTVQLRWPVAG